MYIYNTHIYINTYNIYIHIHIYILFHMYIYICVYINALKLSESKIEFEILP
jgi:hypothetical protein